MLFNFHIPLSVSKCVSGIYRRRDYKHRSVVLKKHVRISLLALGPPVTIMSPLFNQGSGETSLQCCVDFFNSHSSPTHWNLFPSQHNNETVLPRSPVTFSFSLTLVVFNGLGSPFASISPSLPWQLLSWFSFVLCCSAQSPRPFLLLPCKHTGLPSDSDFNPLTFCTSGLSYPN